MGKEDRRAKVTPETKAESERLSALWEAWQRARADRGEPRMSQTEFGEQFKIGNQSFMSQLLRGETPLSIDAAKGFAAGLGCKIEDFSPRLAARAAAIASMVPADSLSREASEIAFAIDSLSGSERKRVIAMCREIISFANPRTPRTPPARQADDKP